MWNSSIFLVLFVRWHLREKLSVAEGYILTSYIEYVDNIAILQMIEHFSGEK